MAANPDDKPAPSSTDARPAERHALATAIEIPAQRVICITLGRAQAAFEIARQRPTASVACWFLDQYQQRLAIDSQSESPPNLSLLCQADLPARAIDLAVLPFSKQGEAELTRETLQTACQRLELGGTLVASVDNPNDRWLREQISELFPKVTVRQHDDAIVYIARKTAEPRKIRDFCCEFVFRDFDRLIKAVSRPGVFSHRHIDPGARQLLAGAAVRPGMRVLDVGCGAGTVAIALAARDPRISVHAVDSNARAIQCTLAGATLNGLENLTAELNAQGDYANPGTFDLAVANPPYYADHRIAEHFLVSAHRTLRPGGRVLLVAKHPEWYEETMPDHWDEVDHWPSKRYHLISATRPE